MRVPPVRTDIDHRTALAEIDALWGARQGTVKGKRLDALLAVVEAYEHKRWPKKPAITKRPRARRSKPLTRKRASELPSLARQPYKAINTSDALELLNWPGAKRGPFYRTVLPQRSRQRIRLGKAI
jgi:hypothetical protein